MWHLPYPPSQSVLSHWIPPTSRVPGDSEVPLWEEQILQPYGFYRLSVCSPRCVSGALDQAKPNRSCYLKPLQKHWKSSGWAFIRGLGAAKEVNCAGEL